MARDVWVLYGSQTGTAEDVADRIARVLERYWFVPHVHALDEIGGERLAQCSTAVVVAATTGQGVEPSNMRQTWRFLLQQRLAKDYLSGMEYAVFALGDSKYERFAYPGKKLHRRLAQLGARPLVERGDGDDQHPQGLDGGLVPWLEALVEVLVAKHGLPPEKSVLLDNALESAFEVFPVIGESEPAASSGFEGLGSAQEFKAQLALNRRLTHQEHFQDVRHLEIDLSNEFPAVRPGDAIMVWPRNDASAVAAAIESLRLENDGRIIVRPRRTGRHSTLPSGPTTLQTLLEEHLDLFGRPRYALFQLAARFATDERQREKLETFCKPEGAAELVEYCYRVQRTAFEVLRDFTSVRLPLRYLIEALGCMRPRAFSASRVFAAGGRVELTVGVLERKTMLVAPRVGVCSSYLASLSPGAELRIEYLRGLLAPVADPQIPLVCIATGTGIAPIRAILHQRFERGETANALVYGCRFAARDQLYADEWAAAVAAGQLELFCAASRDQPSKVYVQHVLRQHGARFWDLLAHRGAHCVICGNSETLPGAVKSAFLAIFQEHGGCGADEASALYRRLEVSGRIQGEFW